MARVCTRRFTRMKKEMLKKSWVPPSIRISREDFAKLCDSISQADEKLLPELLLKMTQVQCSDVIESWEPDELKVKKRYEVLWTECFVPDPKKICLTSSYARHLPETRECKVISINPKRNFVNCRKVVKTKKEAEAIRKTLGSRGLSCVIRDLKADKRQMLERWYEENVAAV